jgi:hypothetical protein
MKTKLLISLIVCICHLTVHAQAVYVDSDTGNDTNLGTKEAPVFSIKKAAEIIRSRDNDIYTMKINPGIYILDKHVSVDTKKEMNNKRIVIEASILPDDPSWTPEKMPIVISTSKKGEVPGENYHYVVSFLINESHVTIRGIKFPGYYYPNTRYFPIARFNKTKTDLLVEQCLFVGEEDASHLQVGIIAHGNRIRADHCVFYNVRNSVVFWMDAGDGLKTGNGITNSIIYGTTQSAVWTAWPDKDFIFENNIVANCNYVWMKNSFNNTRYVMNNCIVVNNNNYQGDESRQPAQFALDENNVIKNGKVLLRKKESNVHLPLPKDYLHIIPGTLGYDMGAGLFKYRKQ